MCVILGINKTLLKEKSHHNKLKLCASLNLERFLKPHVYFSM